MLLLSDMELFVPADAAEESALLESSSSSQQPKARQWLLQGERLRFYLLVHPASAGMGPPPPEFLAGLSVTAHLFDEAASAAAETTSAVQQQPPQQLPLPGPGSAVGPGLGAVRTAALPMPLQQQRRFVALANGDVALPLELHVSVARRRLGRELSLCARVCASSEQQQQQQQPHAPGAVVDALLSATAASAASASSSVREVRAAVRVSQAVRVRAKRLGGGPSTAVVSVAVENAHPAALPVTLHDAALQFAADDVAALGSRALSVHVDRSDLPLALAPHDEYEFAVRVDVAPAGPLLLVQPSFGGADRDAAERVPCWAAVTWSCACTRGAVTVCHDCPALHVPDYRAINASVRLLETCVAPLRPFEAEVSVTNASPEPRTITLVVGEPADPSLQCLRRQTELGTVPPMGTTTARVPLVALRQGVHNVGPISCVVRRSATAIRAVTFTAHERCNVLCSAAAADSLRC